MYVAYNLEILLRLGCLEKEIVPYRKKEISFMEPILNTINKPLFWIDFDREKMKRKLKFAGYKEEKHYQLHIFCKWTLPILLFFLLMMVYKGHIDRYLILVVMPSVIVEYNLRSNIKRRNLEFEKNGYRIYKYLYNQTSSGVRVTDAIKNMYQIVNEKSLKDSLMRFAARYIQTMNIDYALEILREEYSCFEMESFCGAIKQGVETGNNDDLLKKQEQTMFNKYFMSIQKSTDLYKWKCTFIVLIQCLILILMVGIPLIMDLERALNQILKG